MLKCPGVKELFSQINFNKDRNKIICVCVNKDSFPQKNQQKNTDLDFFLYIFAFVCLTMRQPN